MTDPVRVMRFCNKCGFLGKSGETHLRPRDGEYCNYAATITRPTAALPSEDDVERVAFKAMLAAAHWPDLEEGVSEYRLTKHAWNAGKAFAIAAVAPKQIAGDAPFNAAIDAVAAAEGALCRARERADAGDHASIDAELTNLRRARGAILEARAGGGSADGWRDIASAPDDGTVIIAAAADGMVCLAQWGPGWGKGVVTPETGPCWGVSDGSNVITHEGWDTGTGCYLTIEPIVWMPRPSPPKQDPQ